MTQYWTATTGSEVLQGDWIPQCRVPIIPDDFGSSGATFSIETRHTDLIVVSQSCDLVKMASGLVTLCAIHSVPDFEFANPQFVRKGAWEDTRKGRREGLYLLASPVEPDVARAALVVNFRDIHTLPIGYLKSHAATLPSRHRLQPPYLEHFSQAFARFFMRVGLPSAVPPFTD